MLSSLGETAFQGDTERAVLNKVHNYSFSCIVFHMYKYNTCLNDTKIVEVNLFAFAYRLFHEDFSPIYGFKYILSVGSLLVMLSFVSDLVLCAKPSNKVTDISC